MSPSKGFDSNHYRGLATDTQEASLQKAKKAHQIDESGMQDIKLISLQEGESQSGGNVQHDEKKMLKVDTPSDDCQSALVSEKAEKVKKAGSFKADDHFRSRIRCVFFTLFFLNFIRVFDNGILPALTSELKEKHSLTDFEVGTLGSLVYVGEVTGKADLSP